MKDLPRYKNRIIIATLLYFPAAYIGYLATVDYIVPAMIYHVIRAIGFYIIMYHYYRFYRIKYRGDK